MSVFDELAKRRREACNGRIMIMPGCWVFDVPPGYSSELERRDATGRPMFLIGKKGIRCANPHVGEGAFPQSNSSGNWFVPWAHCRKCEHYRKGGTDGLRYPHCNWVRNRRGGDAGAAKEILEVLSAAVEAAEAMIPG